MFARFAIILGVLIGLPSHMAHAELSQENKPMSTAHSVYDFNLTTIDGASKPLSDFTGKTLLIVNVASKCGFTPQYKNLEALYQKYKAQGFEVLGFPANNFLWQEPGTDEEIKKFCSLKYKVTFPMFSKISVKGEDIHPLFSYLTTQPGFSGDVSWNFNKFLIAPDGKLTARFGSKTDPMAEELTKKLEQVLQTKV